MAMKRVTRDGKTLNKRTLDMLERAEARMGFKVYVVQGSYNTGVGASAGTHDGGGAIDISVRGIDYKKAVRALRDVGFAAWYRPARAGVWGAHIHAVAIGDAEVSSGAKAQVAEYYAGQDGLAGYNEDTGYRPDPIPVWPIKIPSVNFGVLRTQFESKKPAKRAAVRVLQRVLNERLDLDIVVDGVAGPQTRGAWKKWQEKTSSKADGVIREAGAKDILDGYARLVVNNNS